MSATLPEFSQCCQPGGAQVVINIPGSPGGGGSPGSPGTNGNNAWTLLTANFTMPAEGGTNTGTMADTSFTTLNEIVFLESIGYLQVAAVLDGTHLTLLNLRNTASGLYTTNAAPGTVAASGKKLVPGGLQGPVGVSGATSTLNSLSPTNTKGDILVDNGVNNPNASLVRLGAGANGTRLVADSTQVTGQRYDKVDLSASAEVKNALAVANGGTGAVNAAAAAVNLAVLPLTGGILTGNLELDGTDPQILLKKTSNALDEKYWVMKFNSNRFDILTANDALGAFQSQFQLFRSGITGTQCLITPDLTLGGSLFIPGKLYTTQLVNTALVNGNNNDVDFGTTAFVKLKAGPSAAFAITGIANGADGRRLTIYNSIGQNLTIADSSGLSSAANRILTMTGADFVSTGNCVVELIYDQDGSRWVMISANG